MKTLYGKKFYRPREIAELKLITNSKGDESRNSYPYILNQIKDGKLVAKNYSRGSKMKYYLISEDEIERFNKELANV